jgi:glutamate-1-semialdehyde aminotransferase
MSQGNSGIKAHDDVVNAAEAVRQAALVGTPTQTAVKNAEIVFYRAVAKSALKNNCGVEAAMSALKSLGVTGI